MVYLSRTVITVLIFVCCIYCHDVTVVATASDVDLKEDEEEEDHILNMMSASLVFFWISVCVDKAMLCVLFAFFLCCRWRQDDANKLTLPFARSECKMWSVTNRAVINCARRCKAHNSDT